MLVEPAASISLQASANVYKNNYKFMQFLKLLADSNSVYV